MVPDALFISSAAPSPHLSCPLLFIPPQQSRVLRHKSPVSSFIYFFFVLILLFVSPNGLVSKTSSYSLHQVLQAGTPGDSSPPAAPPRSHSQSSNPLKTLCTRPATCRLKVYDTSDACLTFLYVNTSHQSHHPNPTATMGHSLIDRIQAKLELFRLEQRYTRRRNRRSTFVSNAVYVDGEYIYQTPNSTGSSAESSTMRIDALHGEKLGGKNTTSTTQANISTESVAPEQQRKRLHRFSSVPGFGGTFSSKDRAQVKERRLSAVDW